MTSAENRAPLVSVVTIARNDRAGLERTMASVRAQSWPHREHVVVDAASTDGSVDLLTSLADSVLWTSEPDGGRYDGMNKGAARAQGEWLWFMNSGDTFARPDAMAAMMEAVLGAPGSRWGYGLTRIGGPASCIGIGGAVPFDFARFMLGGRPIPHQAVVIARHLHEAIGGYDTTFGIGEDQRYLMAAAALAQPVVVPEILCDFDKTGAGSVRSMRHHYLDMRRARHALGLTVTGLAAVDTAWSVALGTLAKLDRVQRHALRFATGQVRRRQRGR